MTTEAVRQKAEANGLGWWIEGLADLVGDLAVRWEVDVDEVLGNATEAWVAHVTRGDGTLAVLKLVLPQDDGGTARREIRALRRAAGRAAPIVLEADEDCGALLLERLGPQLADLRAPYEVRQGILADLMVRWQGRDAAPGTLGAESLDGGDGIATGAQHAERLVEVIERWWAELDRPCSVQAVDQARRAADQRRDAWSPANSVRCHGDIHAWNALRCRREPTGFALVDPDGVLADPALDLGVILREDPEELLEVGPRKVCGNLARRTGVDPLAAWQWSLAERVATGLLATGIGLQPVGAAMLAAADAISGGTRR